MSQYEVGKTWWFAELSRHAVPGEIIELSKERAEHFLHNEPGLLKPVRKTTQGSAGAIRSRKADKVARTRVSRSKK